MFYHEFVLAKRGTLGKVWLAAHWEKKLSRSAIAKHDVVASCKSIITPVTPLALRTSGHLLLGVVRIHDGKAKDLMTDCSNALCQIKRAFTPGADTSMVKTTASKAAITLDETVVNGDYDELPEYFDAEDNLAGQQNVGRQEEISMPAENDFMEADYLAPDMGEAFGDEYAPDTAAVPFYNDNDELEGIEQGRNLAPEDVSAVGAPLDETAGDVTLDHTAGDATMDDQHQPEFEAPDFGDDHLAGDTTLGGEQGGGAFAGADPDFGKDTPHASRRHEDERVEDITLNSLETTAQPKPSQSFVSLGRKRKLIVDAQIEVSSADMRKGLDPDGPNDITRQPYRPDRGPIAFSRPAPTRAAMERQLRDASVEARYARPLTNGGRWKGRLLKAWQRGFDRSLAHLPRADDADEIELGREAPADQSDFRPADQSAALQDDELPPPEFEDEMPPYEPDQGGAAAAAAAAAIDETMDEQPSMAASAFAAAGDSTFTTDFGDEPSQVDGEELQTAEEFEQDHLTRRTVKMISQLRAGFQVTDELSYNDLTRGKSRRTAAACLFELLVLKTKDYVEIEQDAPFADIVVTPTELLQSA